MKRFTLYLTVLFLLQACMSDFLLNRAKNALRYDAIAQLPKNKAIGQQVYMGGEIVKINRTQKLIEVVRRDIDNSGYPDPNTMKFNQRILIKLLPQAQFDYYRNYPGDRIAVLGYLTNIQEIKIGNETITIYEVTAEAYRSWNSRSPFWDDKQWAWGPYIEKPFDPSYRSQ